MTIGFGCGAYRRGIMDLAGGSEWGHGKKAWLDLGPPA